MPTIVTEKIVHVSILSILRNGLSRRVIIPCLRLSGNLGGSRVGIGHLDGRIDKLGIFLGHDLVQLLADDTTAVDRGLKTEYTEQRAVFR